MMGRNGEHPQRNSHAPTDRVKTSRWKFVIYALLSVGSILLVCVLVGIFYPDPIVNTFLKGRITQSLQEAYPAYSIRIAALHYGVRENRLGCDSLVVEAMDSTVRCTVAALSVSGVGWLQLLMGNGLAAKFLASSVLEAEDIVIMFPLSQYELRCGQLRVSVPDSEVIADALELHPTVGDQQFFAESKFRRTRFTLTTRQGRATGVAFAEALDRKNYSARCFHIHDMSLDILINKEKPAIRDTATPPMPNDLLSSMKETIQCDSMHIINGALKYSERFDAGSRPGVITLDSMDVVAEGIANHGDVGTATVIRARGQFMKAGTMNLLMSIPVASPAFSFQYSGSLSRMDLRALNSYIEKAEQIRIKAGVLQAASFTIDVALGRASGNVRAVYRDLNLAAIDKHTGSDKGFVDGLVSFIANTFQIRATNGPDKSGSLKIGNVKYLRQHDDPFFRFVWFALRSGVGDIVGF